MQWNCGGLGSVFCFLADDDDENDAAQSPIIEKKATADLKKKEEHRELNLCCRRRRRRVSPDKSRIERSTNSERMNICTKLSACREGKRSKSNVDWHTKNLDSRTLGTDCNDEVYQIQSMKVLAKSFPTSTQNERYRFSIGRTQGKSMLKMHSYITWREQHNLDGHKFTSAQSRIVDDEECWNFVVSYIADQMKPKIKLTSNLPRIARFGPRSRNGKRVVQILAAMIDLELASQEFYSLCVAAYLHFKLDRCSLETIIVLVDVRAGTGWTNPPAMTLLPFIKTTAKTLSTTMPERLDTCIVYPLPSPAKVIWLIIKSVLDDKHVQKIRILWGSSASPDSPAPVDKMNEFFDMKAIQSIETARLDEFRHDSK